MEIIWTNEARKDLYYFWKYSKKTEKNINKYILEIYKYTESLLMSKELGKKLSFKINNINIYQLIYKEHRILYCIKKQYIYIIGIIHFKRNISTYLNYLKENNILPK